MWLDGGVGAVMDEWIFCNSVDVELGDWMIFDDGVDGELDWWLVISDYLFFHWQDKGTLVGLFLSLLSLISFFQQ